MTELDASWITHDGRNLMSSPERFLCDTLSNHTAAKQCNFHVFCTPFPIWDSTFHDVFCWLDGASWWQPPALPVPPEPLELAHQPLTNCLIGRPAKRLYRKRVVFRSVVTREALIGD
jgi:hypothetical protein